MNPDLLAVVRCPICRGPLDPSASGGEIRCARCEKAWPVEDGVPLFYEGVYRFQVAPAADTAAIVEAAGRGEGAREVGARLSAGERSAWFLEESRADGVLLTPFHPERTVALEVGAGFGGVALPLAGLVARVFAVDASADGVRFIAGRARTEGRGNVHAMTADALALPFADGTFDLVVLNGCLEWVPVSRPDAPPAAVQAEAIKEASRVLREGGALYLAIENRFGAKYWLGARDEHTGLRFVTVLPRPLADRLSRALRKGRPYREHTQSAGRLARWFHDSGLEVAGTYAPLRDYRLFRFLLDCDTPKGLGLLVSRSMPFPTRASRVFLAAARVGLALRLPLAGSPTIRTALYPSIALVGRKGKRAAEAGWLEEAVREDFGAAAWKPTLVVSSGRSATLFVFTPGVRAPIGVMRLQRPGAQRDWVKNEYDYLKLVAGLPDQTVAFSVPQAIRLRRTGGITLTTQEFACGNPIRARRGAAETGLGKVREWLLALGRATARPAPGGQSLADSLSPTLRRIETGAEARGGPVRRRAGAIRRMAEELPAPPLVVCHFDLCPSNVIERDGRIRVVDWEYARWSWAPYDWFRFLCRFALEAAGVHLDMRSPVARDDLLLRGFETAFYRPGPFSACVREQSLAFLSGSGFPAESASSLFVLAVLEYLLLQVPLERSDRLLSLVLGERNVFDGTGL